MSDTSDLLKELEELDEHTTKNMEKLFKQLKNKLLLLALSVGPGGLVLYYNQLMGDIGKEIDTFIGFLDTDLNNFFDRYWELGTKFATTGLSNLEEPILKTIVSVGGLDKQIAGDYIISVAEGAAENLRTRINLQLQRALLGGDDVQGAIKSIISEVIDGRLQESTILKVTSELFGVVQQAQIDTVDEFLLQNPQFKNNVTKTWHWSQVQRPYHAMMDGVTIPYNEKFHVPGGSGVPSAYMIGPHDMSAPIGQIANCKCFMSLGTKE